MPQQAFQVMRLIPVCKFVCEFYALFPCTTPRSLPSKIQRIILCHRKPSKSSGLFGLFVILNLSCCIYSQPFESSHQQQQETQQPLSGRTVTLEMREAQQLMMMRESQLHSQQLPETHQTRDAQLHQLGPIQWDIAPGSVAIGLASEPGD